MAKRVRVVVHRKGVRELQRNASLVAGRAEAIAAACNAESEWGGYDFEVNVSRIRARGLVWSFGANDDEARRNRLVRNIGAT